jgi:hypothetical protein
MFETLWGRKKDKLNKYEVPPAFFRFKEDEIRIISTEMN